MRKVLLGLIIGALLVAQSVWAKGPPQKITISGPGLALEIVITDDETTLNALAMMQLEDYPTLTSDTPSGISGEGYLLTRFYEDSPDHFIPFDKVLYFPNPDGGRGYLQYVGIVGGSSEYDGKWYRPTALGEAMFQAVLVRGQARQQQVEQAALVTTFMNVMAIFAR